MNKGKLAKILCWVLGGVIVLIITGLGLTYYALSGIQRSHLEGNIPDKKDFEGFLARDLTSYFSQTSGRDVSVQYEMLDDRVYQSGVADPKYYVWVNVMDEQTGEKIQEGAVMVAAQEKEGFAIRDVLSKEQIKNDPAELDRAFFPVAIKGQILTKIQN